MERLEALLRRHFHHPDLCSVCRNVISNCLICPLVRTGTHQASQLAPRTAPITPWSEGHINCIGPWNVEINKINLKFDALTCIDPVTNLLEIIRIPESKTAENIRRLFENCWLSRYPRPLRIIHDHGPKFNGHNFQFPLDYAANGIIESTHKTIEANNLVEEAISTAMHALRCNPVSTLGNFSPGALVFNRDMLFNILLHADIITLTKHCQAQIDNRLLRANHKRTKHEYIVGQGVFVTIHDRNKLDLVPSRRRLSTVKFGQFPPQTLLPAAQRKSESLVSLKTSFSSATASHTTTLEDGQLETDFDLPVADDLLGLRKNIATVLPSVIKDLDRACRFNQGRGGAPNGPNNKSKKKWNTSFVRQTVDQYEYYLKHFYHQKDEMDSHSVSNEMKQLFFSPETTQQAFVAWERYIGSVGMTKMTDSLSLSMLEANGKAGNIGRAIQLLSLRKSRDYSPKEQEFVHAITAIDAAGLYLRRNRNIFLGENKQPKIDDPTRWLDAILINMNQRDVALTTKMANRMLNTFARTGRTGKIVHYFYRVLKKKVHDDDNDGDEIHKDTSDNTHEMATVRNRPVQVRINMRPPPPYHKIPSQVRGKLVRKPGSNIKQLKLERESDPNWSPVLTSAISFADSLKQGACGHDPVELDLISYSILMKVCVNRGSLWRAMHILDEVMPANKIQPDIIAYNTLLMGLAKVGDVPTMKEYTRQLLSNGLTPTKDTIEASIDSLLNLGDVGNAITLCQDCFNQYSVLPPYTTHLKILEITLGRGLIFEAKRHVSFIQQLWKWEQNKYHSEGFARMLHATQKNPNLSKEALQKMFAYFGYTLDESDFF
eukprot:jgi/Psemu1/66688/estExt_Genemark1.C_2310007